MSELNLDQINEIIRKTECVEWDRACELLRLQELYKEHKSGIPGQPGFARSTNKLDALRRMKMLHGNIEKLNASIREQTLANCDANVSTEIRALAQAIGVEHEF